MITKGNDVCIYTQDVSKTGYKGKGLQMMNNFKRKYILKPDNSSIYS